jgi:hypothetical protein
MSTVSMAALAVQLLVSGGAGVGERPRDPAPAAASWRELGKRFSSLRKEISQVERDYEAARARHRDELHREERQREEAQGGERAGRRGPAVR